MQAALLWMLLAAFLFASMGALIKAASAHATVWQAVFFRALAGLPLLMGFAWYVRAPIRGSRPWLLMGRSVAGLIGVSLSFYAISRIPLGDATILVATAPIFVALLAPRFTREQVSRRLLGLLPFFLVGIALIVKPKFSSDWVPAMAALLAGFMTAVAQLWVKQLGETEPSVTIVLNFTVMATIGSAVPAFLAWRPLDTRTWFFLLSAGVIATVAQMAMTKAFSMGRASVVSVMTYAGTLFAYLLGILFFHERPDLSSMVGAIVLLTCGFTVARLTS